jgi:predicted dehydrogenase
MTGVNILNKAHKVFNWAYIGAGSIAGTTARAILRTGNHRIVTVYNRTFSKAQTFADKFDAHPCKTIPEAILAEGVDGVYVSTTANVHYEHAKACLEFGKPVLLEKPFTVNRKQAEDLFKLAGSKNVYLAEAMWTWSSPVSRQVRKWIEAGEVGKIQSVEITYSAPIAFFLPRLKDPDLVGGALLDIGVYPITYCYNLFGNPDKVVCWGRIKGGVDTNETVCLAYSNGLKIDVEISMVGRVSEKLVIKGDLGTIQHPFYHFSGKAVLRRKEGGKTVFKGNGLFDNEFDLVAKEIVSGHLESAYVPRQATLDNLAVLDECRQLLGLIYPCEA